MVHEFASLGRYTCAATPVPFKHVAVVPHLVYRPLKEVITGAGMLEFEDEFFGRSGATSIQSVSRTKTEATKVARG